MKPKARAAGHEEIDDVVKDVGQLYDSQFINLLLHFLEQKKSGPGLSDLQEPSLESMDSITREDSKRKFYPVILGQLAQL